MVKFDTSVFKKGPYQQPDQNYHEGSRKHVKVPFFNYSTKWVKDSLKDVGFTFEKKLGCSFFRLDILKKRLSTDILLTLEKLFQNIFSFANISPSIFLKFKASNKQRKEFNTIKDILACPRCKGGLDIQENKSVCTKCKSVYHKKDNIWDFRV